MFFSGAEVQKRRQQKTDDTYIVRTPLSSVLYLLFLTDNQFTVLSGILACRFSAFFAVRSGEPNRQMVFVDHIFDRTLREDAVQAGKLRETLGKRGKPLLQVRVERVDAGFTVRLVENDDRFPLFFLNPIETPPFHDLGKRKEAVSLRGSPFCLQPVDLREFLLQVIREIRAREEKRLSP